MYMEGEVGRGIGKEVERERKTEIVQNVHAGEVEKNFCFLGT